MSTAERLDETATPGPFRLPGSPLSRKLERRRTGLRPRQPDAADHSADARTRARRSKAWRRGPASRSPRSIWSRRTGPPLCIRERPAATCLHSMFSGTGRSNEASPKSAHVPRRPLRRPLRRASAPAAATPAAPTFKPNVATAIPSPDALPADAFALVLYPKIGMLDGRHGHNAWLHELPDPVTKVTWDNYACLSPGAAARLGVEDGDFVRVTPADGAPAIELPAFIQPGQHDAAVAIALGYGRAGTDRFAKVGPPWFEARPLTGLVGVNAAAARRPRRTMRGSIQGDASPWPGPGARAQLASTQVHHSLEPPGSTERRPIIQETTLAELTGAATPAAETAPAGHVEGDLWPDDHPYDRPSLGHDHRPQLVHRLFGVRHRVPGGEQHPGRRPGRSAPATARCTGFASTATTPAPTTTRKWRTSRCCASTATTRRAKRCARCSPRCTARRV